MAEAWEWMQQHLGLTVGLAAAWVAMLVISIGAAYYFLTTIPPDYFNTPHRPLERWRDSHPAIRWTLLIAKNAIGAALVIAGLVMLFTPGQGVLSILLGLSLIDLPGKRAVERRIIQRPTVLDAVNKIRAKANKPPLHIDTHEAATS